MNERLLRDGERLCFDVHGDGPALLLSHGFTGSREAWPPALLAELAREHRLIAVDLLGHGKSSKPSRAERYALEEIVDDLAELLDACEVDRATWVGYSMGGRISLGASVRRPDRVRALVLEGASPGLEGDDERRARVAADEKLALRLEREPLADFVDGWMAQPLFASQARLGADALAEARARRLENDPNALAACLRGLGTGTQPSFWSALAGIRQPVLVLAGESDAKFRDLGARMCDALPNSCCGVVPDAGHTTHLENPKVWADEVRNFVRSLETRS